MQELHENNNDPVHFHFVHGNTQILQSEIAFGNDGRTMHMGTPNRRETPYGTFDTRLETDSWGLGLVAVRIAGIGDAGLLMFCSTSPIDATHSHSRWIFTVTRDLADIAGEDFVQGLQTLVMQDLRIWSNKIHRALLHGRRHHYRTFGPLLPFATANGSRLDRAAVQEGAT